MKLYIFILAALALAGCGTSMEKTVSYYKANQKDLATKLAWCSDHDPMNQFGTSVFRECAIARAADDELRQERFLAAQLEADRQAHENLKTLKPIHF